MRLLRSLSFSSIELTHQVLRLVAIRFMLYLGAMSCYFIGVVGTLTFSMGGGVADNAVAVALLNLLLSVGTAWGGNLLDKVGPERHYRLCVVLLVASGLLYQVLGTTVWGVFVGAAIFGFAWGCAEIVARSYPAYLTADAGELKRINALITLASNAAVVVGPTIGGIIALVAPTQTVFLFLSACAALSVIPGLGFRALRTPAGERAGEAGTGAGSGAVSDAKPALESSSRAGRSSATSGFHEIFASPVLSLLFWATILSFMAYGAFDPLESLFYRDVLKVGAEWMGWLSALSGVGGLVGAALSGMVPTRRVTVRTLLVILSAAGAGCLLYVSTSSVAVACAGQLVLGVFYAMFGPIKDTLVQMHTPLSHIGRVEAALGVGMNLAGVFPLLCAPVLAEMFGVQGTLVAAGVLVTSVPLVILVLRRRELAGDVAVEREREAETACEAEPERE